MFGAGGDIPEIMPTESPVEAYETCIVAAVVHPDIAEVAVRVTDNGSAVEGMCVFDGALQDSKGLIEVADLVGDDFRHGFRVETGSLSLQLYMDNPREARVLTVLIPSGVTEEHAI